MKNSNFKYLVIEDDTNVWANIERRMSRFPEWSVSGFSAEIDDALAKIEQSLPHLIFSDWSIKGGNAFQILNFIKEIDGYNPYVIFFTGYQSEHPEIPQEIMNNYPMVKKYLIKPVYEKLTNNLENYLTEAKNHYFSAIQESPVFLENENRQQIKVNPKEIVAVLQCEENPRIKNIHLKNNHILRVKYTWDGCIDFLQNHKIDFYICNNRKSVVNKSYITKYSKPYIWLENGYKIRVSREKWEGIIN